MGKAININSSLCKDAPNFGLAEIGKVEREQLPPLCIARRYKADWPVGPGEKPMRSEGFHAYVEIGAQRLQRPVLPIGFGDEAGDLTEHIRTLSQSAKIVSPRFKFALGYLWFCCVVEYKPLVRVLVDEACRFYQLMFMNENVVGQIEAGELFYAAMELLPIKISGSLPLNDLT